MTNNNTTRTYTPQGGPGKKPSIDKPAATPKPKPKPKPKDGKK